MLSIIVQQGNNTIKAHLRHLEEHGQTEFLAIARGYLREHGIDVQNDTHETPACSGNPTGCPGSLSTIFTRKNSEAQGLSGKRPSALSHWPIQLHLLSPMATHYQGADLLLAADCTAFSLGDFHKDYLQGRALAIACPKLDQNLEVYSDKLKALIDDARINTLTVMIMEVPCCGGLERLAQQAAASAEREVPIRTIVVTLQGEILRDEWL